MKTLLFLLATTILLAHSAEAQPGDPPAQSAAQLKENIEAKHPAAYYYLAVKLFQDPSTKQEAVFWFYVGQLRYRYHLSANPALPRDGDPALFASLSEVVGRPINEYAGSQPDMWISQINRALAWDKDHSNGFTPKDKSPETYRQIRSGLTAMRDQLAATKDKLPEIRRQNGLK